MEVVNMAEDSKTPLLDQLEEGPWPSFVTEMKRAAEKKDIGQRFAAST
jgi:dissimilatory sulfite reductase alpha subunit